MAYRLLDSADIIDRNDEYLTDDAETWKPVGNNIARGAKYTPGCFQPMRRPVTDQEAEEYHAQFRVSLDTDMQEQER